jgi:hypothetical protein
VVGEVTPQPPHTRCVVEQRERRKLRKIDTLVVDQIRFQAGVGEEQVWAQLWQRFSVERHPLPLDPVGASDGRDPRRAVEPRDRMSIDSLPSNVNTPTHR